jgi:alkylation response protein AidB-like acyl-CoA dehydrogenase
MPSLLANDLVSALAAGAADADATASWPTASWQALQQAGVLGWAVPSEFGGSGRSELELIEGYEALSSACLTTSFLLSQREAAVRRIRDCGQVALRRELLRPLACGGKFATVGISQLTTSRQHTRPAMVARQQGAAFVLDGIMPWVTGAAEADYIVTGAALDDGRQILAALPTDLAGVRVGPPLDLMAVQGSMTAEVHCEKVTLDSRWLLAGPAERVMTSARGGSGGLETTCLALGLTKAALGHLQDEAGVRRELAAIVSTLDATRLRLRAELHQLVGTGATADVAAALRGRANALVLQATQAALVASKGAGFLRRHPAQRWARQALFFLVWSCPRPAVEATLAWLTPSDENTCWG